MIGVDAVELCGPGLSSGLRKNHSFSVYIRCVDQAGYKNQLFHSLITILNLETEIKGLYAVEQKSSWIYIEIPYGCGTSNNKAISSESVKLNFVDPCL